ncbi:MAG: hypothetical protein U0935_23475 [Pirellulales bacterium]
MMTRTTTGIRTALLSCLAGWLASSVLLVGTAGAEDGKYVLRSFRKIKLSDKFYSEGMFYGDFNHDGKLDVAAGPYYCKGPDFQERVEFPAKESSIPTATLMPS